MKEYLYRRKRVVGGSA